MSVHGTAPLRRSNTATSRAERLWTKAIEVLSHEDRQQIDFSRTDKLSPLHDILRLVEQQKDSSLQKQIKVPRSKKESIILRDQFAKIADWVSKFIGVGDALAQYDPAHAAIPWAAIKFVLQAAINESQTFTSMLEGLELVSSIITRYSMVETMYLRNVSKLEDTLTRAIVRLYTSILVFLAYSRKYYRRSTAERLARGVVQTRDMSVGRYLQNISDEERAVESITRSMNEEYMREITWLMNGKLTTLLDGVGRLREQFRDMQISVEKHSSLGKLDQTPVLVWIDAIFTNDDFERALAACRPGTCDWILERRIFRDWMKPKPTSNAASILWIHSYPGFGKTILAARLTKYLQNQHTMPVFFFCFFGDEKKQQPMSVIRSYVAQLVMSSDSGFEIARETYADRVSSKATEMDLWLLFRRLIMGLRDVVLVVDGFDECTREEHGSRNHTNLDVRERFLDQLEESIEYTGTRVLFTSRDNADIRIRCQRNQQSPKPASLRWLPYEITRNDTQGDIQLYAEWIVAQTLNHKQEDLKSDITARLVQKCKGMFLYLHHIQPVLKSNSTKSFAKLQRVIAEMPRGLHEAYERELRAISSSENENRESALSILRWVLYAERPLTVREMVEALLVPIKEDDPLEDWFPQDDLPEVWDKFSAMDRITGLCGSLVDLRGRGVRKPIADQTVHFVHFSVKEYLLGKVKDSFPELARAYFTESVRANDSITRTCLQYLCFSDFKQSDHSSEEQFTSRCSNYAFLHYAVAYLGLHIDRSRPTSKSTMRLCNAFLDPNSMRWLAFSEVMGAGQMTTYEADMSVFRTSYPNPLYYASVWGILGTIQYLLDGGEKINAVGGVLGSSIQAAASNGRIAAVELLIANGASINLADDKSIWGDPLHAAVANGQERICNLLLNQGASVNSHEVTGGYPIISQAVLSLDGVSEHTACSTIRCLIDSGADVEATSKRSEGWTALHYAAAEGSQVVVELLLANGARINHIDRRGFTALSIAAKQGRNAVVETILKHGADCNIVNEDDRSALHWALGVWNVAIITMLLRYGASVTAQTKLGLTPLHLAAEYRGVSEIEAFLEHEADIYQAGYRHVTDSHMVVVRGQRDIATVLLDCGADVNAARDDGQTPLHRAVSYKNQDITALLLDRGADVNTANDNGQTPLHRAVSYKYKDIAALLLDRGADVDAAGDNGQTPLYIAVFYKYQDIAALLLDRGADVNAANDNGQTPLHRAVSYKYKDIAALLLDRGADVDAAGDDGQTPLYIAVLYKYQDTAALLLDRGADVNTARDDGQTPLHRAVTYEYQDIAALLLDRGADINAARDDGQTPLHRAVSYKYQDIAALLLDRGADINAADDNGQTPLHRAVSDKYQDIAALLLDRGAEVNSTDTFNLTPLHMAADLHNSPLTALLINKGADVNAKDYAGNTPLQSVGESHEVAALLLAADADPTILNNYGQDFYDHALRRCWETCFIPPILPSKYTRQNPSVKKRRLHQSVAFYAKQLEHASIDNRRDHYGLIGHCLLLLGDQHDSCTAFERQGVEEPRYGGIKCHSCDLAPRGSPYIIGQRFVCSTCIDVDLCQQCMQEYKLHGGVQMACFENCENHEYLQVPGDGWDKLLAGKVNRLGETEREWLARLIKTYGGEMET